MFLFLYFKTKLFEYQEQKAVQKRFYPNLDYQRLDQALLKNYRFCSPYTISKHYLAQRNVKPIYTYGETPLTTMALIAKECEFTENDFIIEMGAGRGRAALFLSEYIGCKVLAFERIEAFHERLPPSKNLTMVCGDMNGAHFNQATAIYLYGTLLEDEEIAKLCEKFPKGVKIITVSYPLSAYNDRYQTIKTFPGHFPWGETEIYWNERIS